MVHALLAAGALLPLLGLAAGPGRYVLGGPFTDAHKHVWAYWHTLAVLGEGTWPFTSYLSAPQGGVLQDIMLAPALLMLPVTAVLGPVIASHLWVLGSLWFVGASVFWLARRLVGGTAGPLAAGLLAQTSPYLMGYPLTSGVHERLAIWIFPLVALALLRARDGDTGRFDAPLLGLGTLVAIYGCQVYGIFLVVGLGLAAPFLVGRPSWPRLRALLPPLVAIGVALLVGLVAAQVLTNHPENLVPQQAGRLDTRLGVTPFAAIGASLPELFSPWGVAAQHPDDVVDRIWSLSYVGLVPLVAVIAGLIRMRRRSVQVVVGLGLAMTVLAVGPRFELGGRWFWSPPFHAVAHLVPYYGSTPPIWQQAALFPALAGVGVAALVATTRWWVGPIVVVLALAERALVLPVPLIVQTTPLEVSEVVEAIGDEGAVMQFPRVWRDTVLAAPGSFRAQLVHQRPSAATIEMASGAWGGWLPYLRGYSSDWPDSLRCMARGGFRWVLVDREAFSHTTYRDAALEALDRIGPAVADDGTYALYDLASMGVQPESVALPPTGLMSVELRSAGVLGEADLLRVRDLHRYLTCPLDVVDDAPGGPPPLPPPPG